MVMKSRSRYLAVSLVLFLSIGILGQTGCLQAAEPTVKATTDNPKMEFDPHHAALLILHYQNDLVNPKGKFGPIYAERLAKSHVVENTKVVLDACRKAGIPVIYHQFAVTEGYAEIAKKPNPLWAALKKADICTKGTWGDEFVDELKPLKTEVVLSSPSLSAFDGTNLDNVLKAMGVTDLIITGIMSARWVVLSTVISASDGQYYPIVVKDACNDSTDELHNWIFDNIISKTAIITDSKEIASLINK